MYNCFDIAEKLIELSKKDINPMTPMKLLKLTYIAHGYYLAFTDKPLFSNRIEAWRYGPVIPELYHIIKLNDYSFVKGHVSVKKIAKDDNDFLEAIYGAYGKFDGGQLSSKTHENGTPWHQVYTGEWCDKEISNDVIKDYYKKKIDARK